MGESSEFLFRGARALTILHERQLRSFVACWRRAKAAGVGLPESREPAYLSLQALLLHVLEEARECMTWICEQLGLPEHGIDPLPNGSDLDERIDAYLEHLLERWRLPLRRVPPDRFYDAAYPEEWGESYTIAARLEHALAHPMRHELQLEELIAASGA